MSVRSVVRLTVAALVAGASLCVADWEAGTLAALRSRGDYEEAAREIKRVRRNKPDRPPPRRHPRTTFSVAPIRKWINRGRGRTSLSAGWDSVKQRRRSVNWQASYREALDRRKGLLAKISELRQKWRRNSGQLT